MNLTQDMFNILTRTYLKFNLKLLVSSQYRDLNQFSFLFIFSYNYFQFQFHIVPRALTDHIQHFLHIYNAIISYKKINSNYSNRIFKNYNSRKQMILSR